MPECRSLQPSWPGLTDTSAGPEDEQAATARHAQDALEDEAIHRLLTIASINLTVAAGLMAAIGGINRFKSPQKLVSYFGLNPRMHQSGLLFGGLLHHRSRHYRPHLLTPRRNSPARA
ncbi:transposase [Acidimangrovimonas sediminis]|uniref:transposase n=1 Tax=Acidimangrovimonas sediminis TaxID=2056283 RepID=UPI0018ECC7E8|nr:transposase [Acidimangrovimonas sediminis]